MFDPTLVHEWLTRSARRFPDKAAIVAGEKRLMYRDLEERAGRLATGLVSAGVRRHDGVVVFLDNSPESVVSLYGILKAGAAFVILNGAMKAKKLAYILNDSGAAALIGDVWKARVIEEAVRESGRPFPIFWIGDSSSIPSGLSARSSTWEEALTGGSPERGSPLRVRSIDQDLAALIYTSGSTGDPKGVMSSHHNMVSAARSIIEYIGNAPDDIIVDVLPLSFDYGLYQVLMSVMFGGTVVLESFLFPVKVLQAIERERVTGFPLVPTMAAFLLRMQNLEKFDLSSLRYMTNTGAALPPEHIRRIRALFPDVKLFSMFGLTECKRTLYLSPEEVDRRPASVGKAIPNCEVFILDEEGREVPAGEVGELVIRGSNVMRGYWNAPELTAKSYRPGRIPGERWLYSGDYFRKDEEGYLYFLGRKDDMIKCKGERVSPKEVENVLCELDGVAEAAVVGVPDEILGQAAVAFVVRSPGSAISGRDVLKHCAGRLEPYMVPKEVAFVAEMPKSPNGKIDKTALAHPTPVAGPGPASTGGS
ncbi:MAG: AMP-binding protein [Deltaproteobacteria bacterium]|nr:AMP-binding protein [Deltaproteobacteria bacterium]